jgi:trimeric autotransporter adhesin
VGNLVNQHVRFIESGEFLTYPKPTGGNSLDRLIERKQMSTKTTFKRIALVTVAALGFGMTSVAPSNAAGFSTNTGGTETVSVSAAIDGVALRVGVQSQIKVAFTGPAVTAYADDSATVSTSTGGYSATSVKVMPNMRVLSAPATATTTTVTAATASADLSVGAAFANDLSGNGATGADLIGEAIAVAAAHQPVVYAGIKWTPSVAGTYSFLFWDDTDKDGLLGAEKYTIATFTVTDGIGSVAASTVINNGTTVGTSYSAVVKISVKDAAGAATVPNGTDAVTVTATGSAKFSYSYVRGASTAVTGQGTNVAYLTSADFDKSGNAYLGVYDNTAETATITPAVIGGLTTPTITTSTVTFLTPTSYVATNANVAVTALNTTTALDTVGIYRVKLGSTAGITFTAADITASKIVQIGLQSDGTAAPYGNKNIRAVTTVTTAAATATAPGTYAWTSPSVGSLPTYGLFVVVGGTATTLPTLGTNTVEASGNTVKLLAVLNNSAAAGITVSPSAPTLATGGTVSLTVNVADAWTGARSGIAVTASISGRNTGKVLASQITDADGNAVFTYTDTNASGVTTALSDSVTFTTTSPLGATVTSSAVTVSYVSGLTVSTVKMTTPNQALGVAALAVVPQPIAYADGAEAGAVSVSATVTTSTGAVLAGLPVTWTIAGADAAVLSTYKTTYTSSTGVATSRVYAWKSGTYTITATAGTVSATGTITFSQEAAASARTVSAVAADNIVTASVTDRFGNPVKNSIIYARVSAGNGYFGNGVLSTEGTTDANGQVRFVLAGGSATVVVSNISFSAVAGTQVGQTSAPKGYKVNATTNTATVGIFTAYTAGTSTTAEEGVGASFDAAGVSSATVEVSVVDTASTAADAAAEATDAANAATDAANAAAEAADAATAAAQDAADAVAALSTQVSEMVNALKKQITALTNLVIKIQKKVRA